MDAMSDEQLLQVFEQLAKESDVIGIDEMQSFASKAGFTDTEWLQELDHDGTGMLDFKNFVKGVKRMTGHVAETPKIRRKAKQRRASAPVSPSPLNGQHVRTLPSLDDRLVRQSPRLRKTVSMIEGDDLETSDEESSHADAVLRDKIRQLEAEVHRHEAASLEAQDANAELRQQVSTLRRKCGQYEEQINYAEEQSHASEVSQVSFEIQKLRQEKNDMQEMLDKRIAYLEEELDAERSKNKELKQELETQRKNLDEQQKTTKHFKIQATQMQRDLDELRTSAERKIADIQEEAQAILKSRTQDLMSKHAHKIHELEEELQSLQSQLESGKQEWDITRHDLELELGKSREDYQKLEKALADPREYNRRFIQKGLEIAAHKGDSIAAELNGASRDELMEEAKKQGEAASALRAYIDRLLAVVIDKVPEILEVK